MLDEPALIDRATGLGERLVEAAECNERGCSWPSIALPDSPNLTGYPTARRGSGWRCSNCGRRPVMSHSTMLRPGRSIYGRPTRTSATGRISAPSMIWMSALTAPFPCHVLVHGAPGIALSRLRAWELTGDERYRDEAITALNTTQQAVINGLEDGTVNYSLCHGLAGNAEILALGSEMCWVRDSSASGKLAGRSPRPGSGSTGRKSETDPVDVRRLDAESGC
ncbi:MAG: lanthionine synthetase LanC family protein [Thermomicrobiales bacterium]